MIWISLALLAVASAGLTGWVRHYAAAKAVLDFPTSRSSHARPMPRGGGIAIVVTFLAAVMVLGLTGEIADHVTFALLGSGALVAGIGWIDDLGHVAARWRLLTHVCAAGWALIWLGAFPPQALFEIGPFSGWGAFVFALLFLVWLLNLYNFMDGIDGIAGIEAVTAGFSATLVVLLSGQGDHTSAIVPAALAASALGFLVWNYPRARIFMGDVGSGFLGIAFGILSLHAAWAAPQLFWSWAILLGVFIVDATWTLGRRLLRGERIHEAHRSHAYQLAARRTGSHVAVSTTVALINLAWLLPIALAVAMNAIDGFLASLLAYAPLCIAAWYFRAGTRERIDAT